jgi:serine/threonine protein kinase
MQAGKNPLDKYIKLDKLGEGTYGLVYKAKNSETGEVSFCGQVFV